MWEEIKIRIFSIDIRFHEYSFKFIRKQDGGGGISVGFNTILEYSFYHSLQWRGLAFREFPYKMEGSARTHAKNYKIPKI